MPTAARPQQRYDHRLRNLVHGTRDVTIATDLGVPRSTARGWLGKAPKVVVSLDITDLRASELQQEVLKLRRRVRKLTALIRLALVLLRSSGFTLTYERLPDGRAKIRILRAVDRAREYVPLRALLRFLRLSPSRFSAWRRLQHACALDDRSSCPHTSPHRLTAPEVRAISDMVTALEYRHVPTGTLAVLAQRLGKVWASPSTWYHLVRKFGWRRPRLRVHPAKPKVGLRTTQANEMWHIDTTVIRLLDGTRAYLHAVIDNFSRRILAWRVADMFAPVNTVAVLLEASRGTTRSETTPVVLADAGVENVNAQVDDLITTGLLRRVLAFTELKFPNSMIEAWWRSLKHQWLFLHSLESATWCTPSMLVSFKGQLRGVDCWWGRWTVSFCDIALDLGSLENPWCVRAGLCRSQPFQPDQTKDRGGCDAKDDSDFTDRHLATGLTFPWCPKNASVRLCRRPRPWSAAAERRGIVRLVQSGGKM